ncbi:MAG TPA: glycosyltransferase [Polyangiaceae bacterium]|nr:glycosyltransferase [Polyangiaceae bacterium]
MLEAVEVEPGRTLDDYASYAHLAFAVQDLRAEASTLVPAMAKRRVWMVSSTSRGGGVAEMLPRKVALLRELGLSVEWIVITPEEPEFFALTKKIHNLIHGSGVALLTAGEHALYESVSQRIADALAPRLGEDDVVVVHDPQPAGMGAILERRMPSLVTVWRCHIGHEVTTPETEVAWQLLEPYVTTYDHAVFSATQYIPPFLAGKSSVITPAIDPLTPKNRPLSAHHLAGILCNSALMREHGPVLRAPFAQPAQRLRRDGVFVRADDEEEIGILFRPIVTQISRWDRLKGWAPLLDGFALLKRHRHRIRGLDALGRRRLELVRLVLAGPDPASIQDDPEATEVLDELTNRYLALEPELQADVAIISLPMASSYENALMVNALQHCATIVVQNSLREGFGLTVTEAMYKRNAVLGSNAFGLRQQIRDQLDGRLHPAPEDPRVIAEVLIEMLGDARARDRWARSAQRRVHEEFLIFGQLRKWLRLLARAKGGTVLQRPPDALPPGV